MTTSIALSGRIHILDLDETRCAKHWATATFAIERDGAPILACDACLADVMRDAITTDSFVPPVASAIDLDSHLPWGQAA